MTESVQTILLDEIIPGATIRFTVIDGVQYLSIRDFIRHMCEKDNNHAAEIWRRLPHDTKTELNAFCVTFQFRGRGQAEQPVITFPGAVKLLMFLPGETAKQNRSLMTEILVRYFAGDPTLIREIEANASSSDSPITHMTRAATAVNDKAELRLKRKREELEFVKAGMEVYANLSPNGKLDERGTIVFKDAILAIHVRDLIEIEDIKLQQTKEKILTEREHFKAVLDTERQKMIIEDTNPSKSLELDNEIHLADDVHATEVQEQRRKTMCELFMN